MLKHLKIKKDYKDLTNKEKENIVLKAIKRANKDQRKMMDIAIT